MIQVSEPIPGTFHNQKFQVHIPSYGAVAGGDVVVLPDGRNAIVVTVYDSGGRRLCGWSDDPRAIVKIIA